jgi:hypothetical protein
MIDCFVLYEDLLGGKALLDANDPRLINWLSYVEEVLVPWVRTAFPTVGFHRYSDNFSFCIEAGPDEDSASAAFAKLVEISNWFHVTALTFRLQYRGALARGPMHLLPTGSSPRSATNLTGLALGNAYQLEGKAGWGRCIIDKTAKSTASSSGLCLDRDGQLMIDFAARLKVSDVERERVQSAEVACFVREGLDSEVLKLKYEPLVDYLSDTGLDEIASCYRTPADAPQHDPSVES